MSPAAEYVIQTGITLLGVIALAWGLLFAGRRFGMPQLRGPMELLGRLPLDQRRAVCLVRVGEKVLILGSSEAGISKLGEMPQSELPPPEPGQGRAFKDVLKVTLGRKPPANPADGDTAQ
ncbi:MAG: hypothetical protein RJA70_2360 [Pseudomonadota bacterium]